MANVPNAKLDIIAPGTTVALGAVQDILLQQVLHLVRQLLLIAQLVNLCGGGQVRPIRIVNHAIQIIIVQVE